MAMTYTSLIAAKGTAGSLANWVNYTLLDTDVILEEAQSLIYSHLRVREMKAMLAFTMAAAESWKAAPSDYLDPIKLRSLSMGDFMQKIESAVVGARAYDESSGTLGADPFTTAENSQYVIVADTAHGLSQGSKAYFSGASAVSSLDLNGTWPVHSITSDDVYVIDAGTAAGGVVVGGGSAVAYTYQTLVQGAPTQWAIWDERIQFDCAFEQQEGCELLYFKKPTLLSSTNTSNFLCTRYPMLLRTACQAMSADFMKDDAEYQKCVARLMGLIERTHVEGDLQYRGAEIHIENP